ncbi:Acetyltransferase (GNAT) family protein [Streptomyces sp. ADI96-02]|uniref:GNAT family N-acetyltransferase n=1 Tax=Streptomyces sp. ADI96-02 TaxID=1522760 RepID=UPI000F5590DC|nr:GNAT family N-acetyltransferase [Streptomyces sp. ADI96-02]RPK63593.1 Acetyltransferase (GNAT) family protein [Streptomyces sp. ADI96-02]
MTTTARSDDEDAHGNEKESGYEYRDSDGYRIDTDPGRLDIGLVHHWLSTDAFWALGRTRDTVERAVQGSLNFGVYEPDGAQVAYARVVTDRATFAWLCDVYVAPAHRGRGLGVRLATAVRDHLGPYGLKRVPLATLDAHELYARVGFVPVSDPEMLMVLGPTP